MQDQINVEQVVNEAIAKGVEAANATDDKGSNGSEAFQYVQLRVKGQRKVQNQLKKIDAVRKDHYYGYLITRNSGLGTGYGFYKGEAFCDAVAKHLNANGITAYATDRLL